MSNVDSGQCGQHLFDLRKDATFQRRIELVKFDLGGIRSQGHVLGEPQSLSEFSMANQGLFVLGFVMLA